MTPPRVSRTGSLVERSLRRILVLPLLAVARIGVVAMCLATLADIIGRHVLGVAVPGVIELVELALVWSAFAGIAVAFWTGAHIGIELIELLVSRRVLTIISIVNAMTVFIVMALLATLAVREFLDKLSWGDRTTDLALPYTWFWAAAVVGYCAATVLVAARAALRRHGPTSE